MDTITFGLFHDQKSAENAINELSHNGFLSKDISIIMKNQKIGKEVCKSTGAHLAGELLEGLIEFGFSEEKALIYEKYIKAGSILIGITTIDTASTVKQILQRYQAIEIRSLKKNTVKR